MAGWIAGLLLVFRLVWGFVGGEHSRFADFARLRRLGEHISRLLRGRAEPDLGHNPLGAVAVLAILLLLAVTVWSGAFGGEGAEDIHEIAAWALLGLVGLHIIAVVTMSILQRENLVRAMVSGTKPADRHPGAADARGPSLPAVILSAVLVAGAAYGILIYDPQAFTLDRERIDGPDRGASTADPHPGAANRFCRWAAGPFATEIKHSNRLRPLFIVITLMVAVSPRPHLWRAAEILLGADKFAPFGVCDIHMPCAIHARN